MSKTLSQIGEFGLIDTIKKQIGKSSPALCGIGDDTAVIPLNAKKHLLLTTDMLIEGIHFTKTMPALGIGHKALAASISDMAAMGGIPQYAVISLGAPPKCSKKFIASLYKGINRTAKKFNVRIVGGDTVRNTKLVINVAMVGVVNKNDVVYRRGARIGDQVFVTGPLGKSLSSGWHLRFTPRVAQAQHLVKTTKPSAMIDITDGLLADLGHILKESRVGAVIEEDQIPRRKGSRLKQALSDGEDFELLFTVDSSKARQLLKKKNKTFPFYRIGKIVSQREGFKIKKTKGAVQQANLKGFTHF